MAVLGTGKIALAELIERIRPAMGQRASVIVITPAVDERLGADADAHDEAWCGADGAAVGRKMPMMRIQRRQTSMPCWKLLRELGITCYKIAPEVFSRPEARPGHLGEWEWVELPNGHVVPVKQTQDAAWRAVEMRAALVAMIRVIGARTLLTFVLCGVDPGCDCSGRK